MNSRQPCILTTAAAVAVSAAILAHLSTASQQFIMVYRKISEDVKIRALWLWDNGYVKEDICLILGVSKASLDH